MNKKYTHLLAIGLIALGASLFSGCTTTQHVASNQSILDSLGVESVEYAKFSNRNNAFTVTTELTNGQAVTLEDGSKAISFDTLKYVQANPVWSSEIELTGLVRRIPASVPSDPDPSQ